MPNVTDVGEDEGRTPEPQDPAEIAALLLLRKAVAAAGTDFTAIGRDGTIVLITLPDVGWAAAAHAAWSVAERDQQKSKDGYQSHYWNSDNCFSWLPTEAPRAAALRDVEENFEEAVGLGRHCVAITPELDWVPANLIHVADFRLTLQPLAGADVVAIAQALCGDEPTESFADAQAVRVTPRLLRLARRPEQSANAYLFKLTDLLERQSKDAAETTPVPSGSVRETATLDRLHGMDEAVGWGMGLAKDIASAKSGEIPWAAVDRGVLLSGPPGCGKTLYARALAATCKIPLVTGSYATWLGTGHSHQGDLLREMRGTFAKARSLAPAILFIDEIDSFPNRSTLVHVYKDWDIQVVNALLAEVDGIEGRDGVVLVGACNHPNELDPALVRSGRLDRHIRIQLPDVAGLQSILREHLEDDLHGQDLRPAALAAVGMTGADCERFVRAARRRARNADRTLVLEDLMMEICGTNHHTDADLRIAAVHEAGHATALCHLYPHALRAITLTGSSDGGGETHGDLHRAYISADDVHRQLVVMLSGRAAEEVILRMPTSGAGGGDSSDLARATRLAVAATTSLGLDGPSGLLWLGVPDGANLSRLFRDQPALAARVRAVLDKAYDEALTLIRERSAAVKALALALLTKRAIDGEEAAAILARYSVGPAPGVLS